MFLNRVLGGPQVLSFQVVIFGLESSNDMAPIAQGGISIDLIVYRDGLHLKSKHVTVEEGRCHEDAEVMRG